MAMQLMTDEALAMTRDLVRAAGGDLRIVQSAIGKATARSEGNPPKRAAVEAEIRAILTERTGR